MFRIAALCTVSIALLAPNSFGEHWFLKYTPSHRATFEQEWNYKFPNYQSTRWVIALRYPPALAWSRDVKAKAELFTSEGWVRFNEVREESAENRRMLIIDYPHNDPKLRGGFRVRTTLTATIFDQELKQTNHPTHAVAPLAPEKKASYLQATHAFDFHKPEVKSWMDERGLWKSEHEGRMAFGRRVQQELSRTITYSTADGGEWICSQIVKAGFGECCRQAIVGTSILRANKVPARTVCALWAVDNNSKGAHCWVEFFVDGVGWVPFDTGGFGNRRGELIAGMIDFDWVIDAGPLGKQTVAGIDAWPGWWSEGTGNTDNADWTHTDTRVRVLERYR